MFTQPVPIPPDVSCPSFLWKYVLKYDCIRKTRTSYNGSPRIQGTVTLGEIYAASLDQIASKNLWAVSVDKGYIVVGENASNRFAEAPAPKSPLYMGLDHHFHEW